MYQVALELFKELAVPAFEIAFVFGLGSYIVRKFLDMALNGRFRL